MGPPLGPYELCVCMGSGGPARGIDFTIGCCKCLTMSLGTLGPVIHVTRAEERLHQKLKPLSHALCAYEC